MAVQCSKCGEELLGAVNRCWRCGQAFAVQQQAQPSNAPQLPAGVAGEQPMTAIVVENAGNEFAYKPPPRPTTAELIDARRAGMMAMGGTVTSLVLGLCAVVLALFWPPAAIIAVLGLAMGLWGLSSPRRNLALVGMLICCLAIGIGTYGIARGISLAIQKNRAIPLEDVAPTDN